MNKTEVTTVMMAIKTAYPNYYKSQVEIDDAINLWAEMLIDDDTQSIAKGVREYIKNDTTGFPPTIGQIRSKAKEIRLMELEARKRERDQLPEPEVEKIPMPDELREKLKQIFKEV